MKIRSVYWPTNFRNAKFELGIYALPIRPAAFTGLSWECVLSCLTPAAGSARGEGFGRRASLFPPVRKL